MPLAASGVESGLYGKDLQVQTLPPIGSDSSKQDTGIPNVRVLAEVGPYLVANTARLSLFLVHIQTCHLLELGHDTGRHNRWYTGREVVISEKASVENPVDAIVNMR